MLMLDGKHWRNDRKWSGSFQLPLTQVSHACKALLLFLLETALGWVCFFRRHSPTLLVTSIALPSWGIGEFSAGPGPGSFFSSSSNGTSFGNHDSPARILRFWCSVHLGSLVNSCEFLRGCLLPRRKVYSWRSDWWKSCHWNLPTKSAARSPFI